MPRTTIFIQTKKTSGKVKVRFRLTDGRAVQLYHKSEIEADLTDLLKFEIDGTPKKRANFNRDLHNDIKARMSLLETVYNEGVKKGKVFTKDNFDRSVDEALYPDKYKTQEEERLLIPRFIHYIDSNTFGAVRTREYKVVVRQLDRFFKVRNLKDVTIDQLTPDMIFDIHDFFKNEYEYAKKQKYASVYEGMQERNFPKRPAMQNTVMTKMKQLKAFYAALEESDEISISPFRKLGRTRRIEMLREVTNAPIALTLDEVKTIISADVPSTLQDTKDAFLLQIALGCRISDFKAMDMSCIRVEDGIPYVAYFSHKTGMRTNTPLVRFAFDIIKRTNFKLPVLKYVSGKSGYNVKIKELLRYCGINREVETGREDSKVLYAPVYEVASSKTGRKTNVTLCSDAQIDKAIMGLHEKGSSAIKNYDAESLMRKFKIISFAFREDLYKVDDNLNIIE